MGGREFPDEWPTVRPEPRDADLIVSHTRRSPVLALVPKR
jgi:hypothetical protein